MWSHCRGTDPFDPSGQFRAHLHLRSWRCAFNATTLASRILRVMCARPPKGRSPRFRHRPAPPRYGLVCRTELKCLRSRIIGKFPARGLRPGKLPNIPFHGEVQRVVDWKVCECWLRIISGMPIRPLKVSPSIRTTEPRVLFGAMQITAR